MQGPITTQTSTVIQGYDEFEIDLEAILRSQIPLSFRRFQAAPLTSDVIKAIPEHAKGAYILYLDHRPVYAGKTDTRHGFRARLERHAWTIQGRSGLEARRLSFKAVRIMVFSAFDVEAILIAEMKKADPDVLAWNNSGFGSNDPGRNRDGQQPAEFDKLFPIDIDYIPGSFRNPGIVLVSRPPPRQPWVRIPGFLRNPGIPWMNFQPELFCYETSFGS